MFYRRLLAGLLILGVFFAAGVNVSAQKDKDKSKKDKDKKDKKDKDKGDKDKGDKDKGEKVTLKWKFEKDKPFYQKMTTKTDQVMKVMNNEVKQTQDQTFYFSWTPIKQDGDTWKIKQKIEGVSMNINIGGSPISYDSTKDTGANNPLGDFFKALVGSEFTLTLNTKTMKVEKIEGRDEFLKKLVGANPQMEPLLKTILSEEALKEMAEPTFAVIADKPVSKGSKWSKTTTLKMGPIGTYENTYDYTFEGQEKNGKDRIKVETKLKYSPPGDGSAQGGLPFKIKSADLKSSNATGYILFDNKKGRVDESNAKLDLKGSLTIDIGGQSTKVDLSQTQESKVTTADTTLLPAKKDK
jgi:hypothetical protein